MTEGTIIQAGSGYDISCGVLYLKAHLSANSVRSWHKRETWVREVEKRIALGVGSDRPKLMPKIDSKRGDEILRYGAKALGVSADLCERQYIPVQDSIDFGKIGKAYSKVLPQLGSVAREPLGRSRQDIRISREPSGRTRGTRVSFPVRCTTGRRFSSQSRTLTNQLAL